MIYRILADAVLVSHFAFVIFIIFGGLLVLRRRIVLFIHLPALVWGIFVQIFLWQCPLTPLENWFRHLGGEAGYSGGFIEYYILMLLYPGIGFWIHILLGLILLAINLAVYSYVFSHWRRMK
ncbi:MAG TPA: DUF2784 domain-containing protein [Pyrinomonadaceae bacterium]|nr:DUF2784 domain-containing protein [Pyrinomonadaceae bacterium]